MCLLNAKQKGKKGEIISMKMFGFCLNEELDVCVCVFPLHLFICLLKTKEKVNTRKRERVRSRQAVGCYRVHGTAMIPSRRIQCSRDVVIVPTGVLLFLAIIPKISD